MSVGINPWQNGIHSLAEALKSFKNFHENQTDVYALKNSIMYSHHALETLFKEFLFSVNPALLLDEDTRVKKVVEGYEKFLTGENATMLDDSHTIDLIGTLDRLKKYGLVKGINNEEYDQFLDAVKRLKFYRNRIQHYALTADAYEISRILGNVLPRAVDIVDTTLPTFFINNFLMRELRVGFVKGELKKLLPESQDILELLRNDYDVLVKQSVDFFNKKTFDKQELHVKIKDYGRHTDLPELQMEGFLNIKYDYTDLTQYSYRLRTYTQAKDLEEVPYRANVILAPLKESKGPVVNGYETQIGEGKLEFNASMFFDSAGDILNLPDADEKIRMLRRISVEMNISLIYVADAYISQGHYQLYKLIKATGKQSIITKTLPKGFERKDKELVGHYETEINETNTHLKFHAFREPNGDLKPMHDLELNIDTVSTLRYE